MLPESQSVPIIPLRQEKRRWRQEIHRLHKIWSLVSVGVVWDERKTIRRRTRE